MRHFLSHFGMCLLTCSLWHIGYHYLFEGNDRLHRIATISADTGKKMIVVFKE